MFWPRVTLVNKSKTVKKNELLEMNVNGIKLNMKRATFLIFILVVECTKITKTEIKQKKNE